MARKKKNNDGGGAPENFPEKQWNLLSETWRDAVQTKSQDELEKEVIKAVRSMSSTTFDMKNDEKLAELQENIKYLKGGYTEAININKAQMDYCVYLMNERGIPLAQDVIQSIKDSKTEE